MPLVPWRALTKAISIQGMIKTNALSLLLLLASILPETNSNLWILQDFIFKRNLDFINNLNVNPSELLPHWLFCIHFLYGMCVNLIPEHTYYEYSVWIVKSGMTPEVMKLYIMP
jgi:hypothetical protein